MRKEEGGAGHYKSEDGEDYRKGSSFTYFFVPRGVSLSLADAHKSFALRL